VVYDTSKAVVPDANVTITGPIGSQTKTSNAQGAYLFTDLIPGTYTVKTEKQGFRTVQMANVQVLINQTASVDVTLSAGSVSTTVEVSSAAVSIDPNSSSVNTNLPDTLYDSLPVKRNVSSVIKLAPGVVSGLGTTSMLVETSDLPSNEDVNPSISGASGLENLYVADGVVLNDPAFGGFGAFSPNYGALGVGITPAFVKEVEVKTAAFEPQYGHSTGGVIQIVTKSGGTSFHGKIGGFFGPRPVQSEFKNFDDFHPLNLIGRHLYNGYAEADAELGGYVPLGFLRNRLFFFGAFDPTWAHNYVAPALGSGLFNFYHGDLDREITTYGYAAKLTYKLTNSSTIESSVFGDPNSTPALPWQTLTADNTSVNTTWNYGTRSWSTRFSGALSPTWSADFSFLYNWNHFTETPGVSVFPIEDQTQTGACSGTTCPDVSLQRGDFQAQGPSFLANYTSNTKSIAFDTSKQFTFAGTHTFSIGYTWQFPTYDAATIYSTPRYTIPAVNATGGDPGTGAAAGLTSDASLQLQIADPTCTLCPLMNVPGFAAPVPVVLKQARGRFDSGVSENTGKYHAAYANDSWAMSNRVTLNLGLRWEQQRLTGSAAHAFFNDQWSPRIGFIVDPMGDRKSTIYANYARLAFVLPLDMAVRELSSEDDSLDDYFAPVSSGGMVTLNQYGTVNFQPDAAHLLNNAVGGIGTPVSIEIQSGGEPFVKGIRMEYNDEFVVGAEHRFGGGIFASARYIDRRMKRVVEDEVGASVEQLTALAFNGGSYTYIIGNPSASQDIFVNPKEITWQPADPTNPNASAPAGCFDSLGHETIYLSGEMQNTFGANVGAACFPAVNMNPWTDAAGNVLPGALFGGEFQPDGNPDPYPNAQRNYQAVEFEVNKNFSHGWQLLSNFRIGRLVGNYEGAFRNDNSQSDPGISSLFDLTPGELGLLGQQLGIGPLNTDRKYVLNVFPSYTLSRGFAKDLVLGAGLNIESGVPFSTLVAQEIYGNAGEVPLYGRGDLGRGPVTGTIDAHLEYPWRMSETKQLKFQFDAFNIANTTREILIQQEADLGFQVLNADFQKPRRFVPPFSSRFSVLFTF